MLQDYGTDENFGAESLDQFSHLIKDSSSIDFSQREKDPLFSPAFLREGLPPVTCNYGKGDYWDGRYMKAKETFEWYHEYPEIQQIINLYAARDGKVLICGCGNSRLTEDMYFDGYTDLVNVDLSRVVIDQMQTKYEDIPEMTWRQMDVCDSPYEAIEFDCAIDKGCLDSVFCADLALKKVKKYVHEMDRILKHGGAWIIFSHAPPEDRLGHLEFDDGGASFDFLTFDVHVHAVAKPLYKDPYGIADLKDPDELYFVYVCIKHPAKSKIKDDRTNKIFSQDEGKKALVKKLKELKEKQMEEGHLAKTPTRDAFGNLREVKVKVVAAKAGNNADDLAGDLSDYVPA